MPIKSLAACASLLALPLLVMAAPVTLRIASDSPSLGPIVAAPAILRGYNLGNWMQIGEFAGEMRQAPAAALRFPGGNAGDDEDLNGTRLDLFKTNL
jgi:hypothetical protein